jgi:hypothetical protein
MSNSLHFDFWDEFSGLGKVIWEVLESVLLRLVAESQKTDVC